MENIEATQNRLVGGQRLWKIVLAKYINKKCLSLKYIVMYVSLIQSIKKARGNITKNMELY